jgi:hypothetical protein
MKFLFTTSTVFLYSSFVTAQGTFKSPTGVSQVSVTPPGPVCSRSQQAAGNGSQIQTGFCSSTPQGLIPPSNMMMSSLIIAPPHMSEVDASKDIIIKIDNLNFAPGYFAGKTLVSFMIKTI